MSSPLRPQFFCARPNGTITPLIAVDELPSHISIRGVPRTLSANETQGMTSLGTVSPRAQTYIIDGLVPASTRASSGPRSRDFDLQASLMRLVSDENVPANQRLAVNALLQQGISQNWFMSNASTSSWLVPSSSGCTGGSGSSRQGAHYNSKKEFCSYWIRHGECDYQQQGCLYKHEMPNDLPTLEKLGLRDIPRWYREKYGIPSLLPNGHGHPRSHASHAQHWKDDAVERGAMKSIQYPSRLEINGAIESSDIEKASKQKAAHYLSSQQHATGATGPSRHAYPAASSPKTSTNPKHVHKHIPGPVNSVPRRIDLLTFDPLPEYPTLDHMGGGMSDLPYPSPTDHAAIENVDRVQHEEFVRNLHSLMPAPIATSADYPSTSFEGAPTQPRSKKSQKSRRLYQPLSQMIMHDMSMEKREVDSCGTYHSHATASPGAVSVISKDTPISLLASPIPDPSHVGAASSEPPTRGASPSTHSGASFSSGSSPRTRRNQFKGKDPRTMQAPIGTKRVNRSTGSPVNYEF
ncbi:hypothetical protein BDV27DRAFT_165140 [Aspergillus caelatus]|uniref:C3H1-type domain-containing protein n=1 Tax=Aspergillus caelatus TaxID=61420 RepID=A0A5N7A440_9EURO|nr:uncharacterized protein BDV27DRAFT_165140 [Aspergillus caelatus]KAE8363966.1 hypothetical protein BDV27DRAFT_165140 [Aspergillus caelatus]